jgi:O-antigen ligase
MLLVLTAVPMAAALRRFVSTSTVVAAGIGFLAWISIDFQYLSGRFGDLFSEQGDSSTQVRILVLKYGLSMLRDEWLFGIGINVFPLRIERLVGAFGMHNSYVTIALEQGIVGVVTHAFFLAGIARMLRRAARAATSAYLQEIIRGASIGLVGYALMMTTGNTLMSQAIGFFVLGICVVAYRGAMDEQARAGL